MSDFFIKPYAGRLVDLVIDDDVTRSLTEESGSYAEHVLTEYQLCDLNLLLNGAFSPLTGFMDKKTYESVLHTMRLPSGVMWPVPIVLDVAEEKAQSYQLGEKLALRDKEGFMLAILTITDVWKADKEQEAASVFGDTNSQHVGVNELYHKRQDYYIGGDLVGCQLPLKSAFSLYWDTPKSLRDFFKKRGWKRVIALNATHALHRFERDLILQATRERQVHALIHPLINMASGQRYLHGHIQCYKQMLLHLVPHLAELSLLTYAERFAGPKEALLHMIIRQNYGCSHHIMGSNYASPSPVGNVDFYHEYAAQEMVLAHQESFDISMVAIETHRYVPARGKYVTQGDIDTQQLQADDFSHEDLIAHLYHERAVPEWFSYDNIVNILKAAYPPKTQVGITLFFTGLSGSGKSTVAQLLYGQLIEMCGRSVTLLDGDRVRHNLSRGLTFSKADRDINVLRIGFVANEITRNGGIAICAPIAPYASIRQQVRDLIEPNGSFIEIHVATSLAGCEERDRKGLYAKARKGEIPNFTGISDPYDVPGNPEIRLHTEGSTPLESMQEVYLYLLSAGFFHPELSV
jgi:sulfate adenylyltransferase